MQLLVFRVDTDLALDVPPASLRDALAAADRPSGRVEHSYWRREADSWVAALWVGAGTETASCADLIRQVFDRLERRATVSAGPPR